MARKKGVFKKIHTIDRIFRHSFLSRLEPFPHPIQRERKKERKKEKPLFNVDNTVTVVDNNSFEKKKFFQKDRIYCSGWGGGTSILST